MWWLRRLIVLLCKVLLSERQHTTRKNTFGAAGRYRNDQWIDAIFDVSSLPLDHSPWSSPCTVQPLVPSCRILPVVRRMSYLPPAWFNNHTQQIQVLLQITRILCIQLLQCDSITVIQSQSLVCLSSLKFSWRVAAYDRQTDRHVCHS